MNKKIILNESAFTALCDSGRIISQHGVYGPKVVLLPNGDYLKVFNPKPGFTKRHFFPKYKTFIKNAEKLNRYNVPCVQIKQVYFLSHHQSYAVTYTPLEGVDCRTLALDDPEKTLNDLIPFLVMLHEKGIYFRGMHLGNILRLEHGKHGLIDMADLYFKRGPLSIFTRVRNLAHLLRNKDDAPIYERFGIQKFLNAYAKEARISGIYLILFNVIARKRS